MIHSAGLKPPVQIAGTSMFSARGHDGNAPCIARPEALLRFSLADPRTVEDTGRVLLEDTHRGAKPNDTIGIDSHIGDCTAAGVRRSYSFCRTKPRTGLEGSREHSSRRGQGRFK